MKFYPSQTDALLQNIANGKINAILLFGPDKGRIQSICGTIAHKLNLISRSITYSSCTKSNLSVILNSLDLFHQREFIKITDVTSSITAEMKEFLSQPHPSHQHFMVFIADTLTTSSAIRIFFEKTESVASICCYPEETRNIAKIVATKIKEHNKTIEYDALQYFASCTPIDYQFMLSELKKLLLYTHDKNIVTLEDVVLAVSDNSSINMDELCIAFAKNDRAKLFVEFNKLKAQEIHSITVIKAIMRFYQNLYAVLIKMQNGASIDEAINSAPHTVFYKTLPFFKQLVLNIKLSDVLQTLNKLLQAELNIKTKSNEFDFMQLILS